MSKHSLVKQLVKPWKKTHPPKESHNIQNVKKDYDYLQTHQ